MERVKPFIKALMGAGNLDIFQALTLIYYCIMTWSDKPDIRPIINNNGESGTGKNGMMNQMLGWCRKPKWINARNKTEPQLRDDLADTKTAFVEEADKTKDQEKCENWYQQRYGRTAEWTTYKKSYVNQKCKPYIQDEYHNHFGYTFLHTQNPLKSSEMDRRTIRITIFKDSNRMYQITQGLDPTILQKIADEVDWNAQIPQTVSNSAWDAWLPLMRVAAHLGDDGFLSYAKEQITAKVEEDDDTKMFEPKGIILSEIIPLYQTALDKGESHIAITTVRQKLVGRGYNYFERDISKMARDLGFIIVKPSNKAHIKVEGIQRLKDIASKAGVQLESEDAIPKPTFQGLY